MSSREKPVSSPAADEDSNTDIDEEEENRMFLCDFDKNKEQRNLDSQARRAAIYVRTPSDDCPIMHEVYLPASTSGSEIGKSSSGVSSASGEISPGISASSKSDASSGKATASKLQKTPEKSEKECKSGMKNLDVAKSPGSRSKSPSPIKELLAAGKAAADWAASVFKSKDHRARNVDQAGELLDDCNPEASKEKRELKKKSSTSKLAIPKNLKMLDSSPEDADIESESTSSTDLTLSSASDLKEKVDTPDLTEVAIDDESKSMETDEQDLAENEPGDADATKPRPTPVRVAEGASDLPTNRAEADEPSEKPEPEDLTTNRAEADEPNEKSEPRDLTKNFNLKEPKDEASSSPSKRRKL